MKFGEMKFGDSHLNSPTTGKITVPKGDFYVPADGRLPT